MSAAAELTRAPELLPVPMGVPIGRERISPAASGCQDR
jgi:hypothetical protein